MEDRERLMYIDICHYSNIEHYDCIINFVDPAGVNGCAFGQYNFRMGNRSELTRKLPYQFILHYQINLINHTVTHP